MRNDYDPYLTGDKFILQTNSVAPDLEKIEPKPFANIAPKTTDSKTPKTK